MNCPCDDFRFPPEPSIAAGLPALPRQIGTFAEFRRALLRAASIRSTAALETHPLWSQRYLLERDRNALKLVLLAIGSWRGRHPEDFGVMLFEMWAYVCDLTSFYDQVLADEMYVRTAQRRTSLRKLVAPLGYVARPAVAALADLAVFADGRQVVNVPAGTAFRSGAFGGNPPQRFEVTADSTVHPLLNEWLVMPVRPQFLPAGSLDSLLCRPGTVSVKKNDLVLVHAGATAAPRHVAQVADYASPDGNKYVRVSFDAAMTISANSDYASSQLLKPGAIATQWKRSVGGETAVDSNSVYLDTIYRQIRGGQSIILEGGGVLQATTVDHNEDSTRTVTAAGSVTFTPSGGTATTVSVPAVQAPVSRVVFTDTIDGTIQAASPNINIHHAFASGGAITAEALTEIDRNDPLGVRMPAEMPRDAKPPGNFELEDKNGLGLERPGTLDFSTGNFSVQGDPWPQKLVPPVRLFGNVVATSRGETVEAEVLGAGDGTIANQSFTLKKSPLTYLPSPSTETPSGLTTTLRVYVDGIRWTEVPTFYGHTSDEEIYVVRQNDRSESAVTFGDGVLGRRLSTGAVVLAWYRFGGGAAMPPPGSIAQIAKPVPGVRAVRNPIAAYGGADAEAASGLQKYAPRSALLLGRAVSLKDLEAAAASYTGVRAVTAEWQWSSELQVPAAHIWYLADGDLDELLLNHLHNLTQPDTPIHVARAQPWLAFLLIELAIDPRRFEDDVITAARAALMDSDSGLLAPERIGIGKPLFRSRLFEFLLHVPGVESVTGLWPFFDWGYKPPAGYYFDFTEWLFINGRNV